MQQSAWATTIDTRTVSVETATVGGMTVPTARHDFAGVVSSRLSPTSKSAADQSVAPIIGCIEEIFP
jgi:hypothetical protein